MVPFLIMEIGEWENMILGKETIKNLMKNGLVENMVDADIQIQPDGVDLTIGDILVPWDKGVIDFDNSVRHVSGLRRLPPSEDNIYHLVRGNAYVIRIRERINLPKNVAALIKSRSSLIRSCVYIESAVWDPGYSGSGSIILHVGNPYGLDLTTNARICQIVFFEVDADTEGYSGIYQGEGR
jgi:dUTP pyrophosphatase